MRKHTNRVKESELRNNNLVIFIVILLTIAFTIATVILTNWRMTEATKSVVVPASEQGGLGPSYPNPWVNGGLDAGSNPGINHNKGGDQVVTKDAEKDGSKDAVKEESQKPSPKDQSAGRSQNEAAPQVPTEARASEQTGGRPIPDKYIIQEGDTLSKLSGAFGVPLDELVEKNSVKDPNLIYKDSTLLLK